MCLMLAQCCKFAIGLMPSDCEIDWSQSPLFQYASMKIACRQRSKKHIIGLLSGFILIKIQETRCPPLQLPFAFPFLKSKHCYWLLLCPHKKQNELSCFTFLVKLLSSGSLTIIVLEPNTVPLEYKLPACTLFHKQGVFLSSFSHSPPVPASPLNLSKGYCTYPHNWDIASLMSTHYDQFWCCVNGWLCS